MLIIDDDRHKYEERVCRVHAGKVSAESDHYSALIRITNARKSHISLAVTHR